MNTALTPIVNNALPLCGVAAVAKRLQVVWGIGAAKTKRHDVIHSQLSMLSASGAASIWRVSAQDSLPLCFCAMTIGVFFAGAVALFGDAVGFGIACAVVAHIGVTALSIGLAPFGRELVQVLPVALSISAFVLENLFWILLAVAFIALPLLIRMSARVITLIGGAANMTLGLLAVRVPTVRREIVNWLRNLALGTGFAENRHCSISHVDWAMPRPLQRRVVFSCPDFTTSLSKNKWQARGAA